MKQNERWGGGEGFCEKGKRKYFFRKKWYVRREDLHLVENLIPCTIASEDFQER